MSRRRLLAAVVGRPWGLVLLGLLLVLVADGLVVSQARGATSGAVAVAAAQSAPAAHVPAPTSTLMALKDRTVTRAARSRPGPRVSPSARPVRAPDPWRWFGFDVSWPQCGAQGPVLPPPVGSFAVVGLTGGKPLTTNPCLVSEWQWALSRPRRAGYLNLSSPPTGTAPTTWGALTVDDALRRARAAGVHLHGVWLDVEVGNAWSADRAANLAVIDGAARALAAAGTQPGVYSSPADWAQITGDAQLLLPEWKAVPDGRRLGEGCRSAGFGRRSADLVQAVFRAADGHAVDGSAQCTTRPDLVRLLG